ncbi:MAG TPA: dehydrogenase, partial [Actinobacteria bacterium]|nr:dehydrogenase [Actinomycetota bacterium]
MLRQLKDRDLTAFGETAYSKRSIELQPRTKTADKVVKSICPYCAVGCGQNVYVKDGRITDIEGDPDSPISEGCLCPKGAATFQLVTGSHRTHQVLYRKPYGTAWEPL